MQTSFRVQQVEPDRLVVNEVYQRQLYKRHVKNIISKFDPKLVDPIRVYDREGTLEVIDGQHTLEVLRHFGWNKVPVIVLNGSTDETTAAGYFVLKNSGQKGLSALEMFKADLVAENPRALEINRIVQESGQTVSGHGIKSVKALQRVFDEGGGYGLSSVLEVLTSTWQSDEDGVFNGTMIKGMYVFLSEHPNRDRNKIIEKLKRTSPADILRRAMVTGGGGHGSGIARTAEQLDKAYRKHKF